LGPASTEQRGVLAQPGRPLRWAALIVAALGIAATGLAWGGYDSQHGRVVDEAQLRARGAAADVDRYVQSHWRTLNALAANPVFSTGDPDRIRPVLEDAATRDLGFDAGVSWVDREGWLRTRSGGYDGPPISFLDRPHIREALATGQPTVSSALIGSINQAPIVGFVAPTLGPDGTLNGLVGSGIRLGDLSMGADTLRFAGGTDVVVVDALGQLVAGPVAVNDLTPVADGFRLEEMQAAGEGVFESTTGPMGADDQLVAFALAPSADWLVLVQLPASAVFGPINAALAIQLTLIAAATILAMLVLTWMSRRLDAAVEAQTVAYSLERSTRQQLEEAIATLEKRQVLRDAFVGVMSHELRTPVTTIYGAAKLLARSPRRPELESLVEDIEEEADRLHRITEDLLVLSKAEHGLVEIRPEPVLVQRLVPAVVAEVARRHPRLQVTQDVMPALGPISGDEGALRQVLVNLLTNAAKYGDGAPVRVVVSAAGADATIRIEDSGPGLPEEELERIFDLFYRSAVSAKRASGTGIGLYVVRQLVLAMGGTVHAYPVEPTGLGFLVTLRAEALTDGEPDLPARRPLGTLATPRPQPPVPDTVPTGDGFGLAAGATD
jgi:signal transduction histidine kinase